MTRVSIDSGGGDHRLVAKGHADSVETCNYITGVLYALAGFACNEDHRGHATLRSLRTRPGDVEIHVEGGTRIEAAFEMACVGLLELEKTHPDAIKVTILR